MKRLCDVETTTLVWFTLIAMTLISWLLGIDTTNSARIGSVVVLLVAFFKVRLVGIHFMEIGHAPRLLRIAFETWVVVVCSGLIVSYLAQ